MPPDKYQSYLDLSKSEVRCVDYCIRFIPRDTPVAIIAPHGGQIELGTSEIATAIASDSYSLYCFEGLKPGRSHDDLHITSHKFDEESCVALVSRSDVVIAVHGRKDDGDVKTICLGGLDSALRDSISLRLRNARFQTQTDGHDFPAKHRLNICNRGRRNMGVQLELPLSLREKLLSDGNLLRDFVDSVRSAIVIPTA